MSMTRDHGEITFICDECQDTLETGETNGSDAHIIRRNEGWTTIPVAKGDIRDLCPECGKDNDDEIEIVGIDD